MNPLGNGTSLTHLLSTCWMHDADLGTGKDMKEAERQARARCSKIKQFPAKVMETSHRNMGPTLPSHGLPLIWTSASFMALLFLLLQFPLLMHPTRILCGLPRTDSLHPCPPPASHLQINYSLLDPPKVPKGKFSQRSEKMQKERKTIKQDKIIKVQPLNKVKDLQFLLKGNR